MPREGIPGLNSDGYLWIRPLFWQGAVLKLWPQSNSEFPKMSKQSLNYLTIQATGESFTVDPTGFILIFKAGLILHCNWNFWPQESQWRPPNRGCCPCALVQWCKNPRDQQCSRGHSCQALSFGFSSAVQNTSCIKNEVACQRYTFVKKQMEKISDALHSYNHSNRTNMYLLWHQKDIKFNAKIPKH